MHTGLKYTGLKTWVVGVPPLAIILVDPILTLKWCGVIIVRLGWVPRWLKGKTVRNRHGPAAVTGDENRWQPAGVYCTGGCNATAKKAGRRGK